jgi:hypothetical protein
VIKALYLIDRGGMSESKQAYSISPDGRFLSLTSPEALLQSHQSGDSGDYPEAILVSTRVPLAQGFLHMNLPWTWPLLVVYLEDRYAAHDGADPRRVKVHVEVHWLKLMIDLVDCGLQSVKRVCSSSEEEDDQGSGCCTVWGEHGGTPRMRVADAGDKSKQVLG